MIGMSNLGKHLKTAVEASIMAGEAIMDVYNKDFDVEYKEDESPLTEADKEANNIINSYLLDTEIPIISEENKQILYEDRKNWDLCWIVDPVDGTKEFVKKNGEFTVNIALVKKGRPILGVIFVPASKDLFIGNVEEGKSYKIELLDFSLNYGEISRMLKPLNPKSKTDKLRIVGSRSHMNDKTKNYISSFEEKGDKVEIVSRGSSLKFCLLAEGLADIYPRFAPTMEWDTAAGQAICNAVGIEVISQETGESLRYNKKNLLNPEFIVSCNNERSS